MSTLHEISKILRDEPDPERALTAMTESVARRLGADVCSVYVHDSSSAELVLRANHGFPPGSVGSVRMKVDEGLTGRAFSSPEPVVVPVASLDGHYKYFPQIQEERFPSFLAVSLRLGGRPTGVLSVQTREVRHFSQEEIDLLYALGGPVAQALEILALSALGRQKAEQAGARSETTSPEPDFHGLTFRGVGASPGIGIGPVLLRGFCSGDEEAELRTSDDPEGEADRLRQAGERARAELGRIRQDSGLKSASSEGAILEVYSMLLDEGALPAKVLGHIAKGHRAESAIRIVVEDALAGLEGARDDYLRDRAFDIQEVGRLLLDSLRGLAEPWRIPAEGGPFILAARALGVTDMLGLDTRSLAGIVSVEGGVHSHASIIARSQGIPLVIGVKEIEGNLAEGRTVIVNGSAGLVHVDPPPVVLEAYERERAAHVRERLEQSAETVAGNRLPRPTNTRDGRRIIIGANVGLLSHLDAAQRVGAEEIGLYRTEFPFLIRRTFPSEEDQILLYTQVVERMEGRPVTIRTLDVGGDRMISNLTQPGEENPSLGWRSIRISLDREDLFRSQLRAILRAAAKGSVKLLLPMISRIEEIRRTRAILREVAAELAAEGVAHDPNVPLGAMIEVPAAALIIEKILAEVDFVSIGTNDLVQYTLAVDRNNAKVSPLFDPYHPAILKLVHSVAEHGNRVGKPVSVCGESAADPAYAALLVGLGVRGLSVDPSAIPRLQQALAGVRFQEIEAIAHKILKADSVEALKTEAFAHLREVGYLESSRTDAGRTGFAATQYP